MLAVRPSIAEGFPTACSQDKVHGKSDVSFHLGQDTLQTFQNLTYSKLVDYCTQSPFRKKGVENI